MWTKPLSLDFSSLEVNPSLKACAGPSAIRLLACLPYRMSKQAQGAQTRDSSPAPFPGPCTPLAEVL